MNANANIRLGMAQVNLLVGDIEGNTRKVLEYAHRAQQEQIDLIVFTELTLTGYPPEDLVLKPMFIDSIRTAVLAFAKETADGGPAVLLGAPVGAWRSLPALNFSSQRSLRM